MGTTLTTYDTNAPPPETQADTPYKSKTVREIAAAFNAMHDAPLIKCLEAYRPHKGRRGYGPRSLWRIYMASFLLGVPSICALHRRLEDDPELQRLCGLEPDTIPSRSTISRFMGRLANHEDLMLKCLQGIGGEFKERLEGCGERVAIDASIVPAYASRFTGADPDARRTKKTGKSGRVRNYFGFKCHLMVCVRYGLPLAVLATPANRYDGHLLEPLLAQATAGHDWFAPKVVSADKGYDAGFVYDTIDKYGAAAVIPLISLPGGATPGLDGPYTEGGQLTCIGGRVMDVLATDPVKGTLYRCPSEGCHLAERKGVLYCQDELWDKPPRDLRLAPAIPRSSPEWRENYGERQSVERAFKSLKQHRRLTEHNMIGLAKVRMHFTASVLAMAASMLARLRAGDEEGMRWMVRKVA